MNYALIKNGVVTNVIWLHPANAAEFLNAVPMHDVPAAVGDNYVDGFFYRDGERILSPIEQAQLETEAAANAYAEGVQDA